MIRFLWAGCFDLLIALTRLGNWAERLLISLDVVSDLGARGLGTRSSDIGGV